jgi:hypothetical protein
MGDMQWAVLPGGPPLPSLNNQCCAAHAHAKQWSPALGNTYFNVVVVVWLIRMAFTQLRTGICQPFARPQGTHACSIAPPGYAVLVVPGSLLQ